jgi:hypothetical protein
MHAIWSQLLDDEFMEAYVHGMLVECVDGTVRRFFPRIFTYSADYPEKYVFKLSCFLMLSDPRTHRTLLACIKNLGTFPCPRCLVAKAEIPALGTELDMQRRQCAPGIRTDNDSWKHRVERARKAIYVKGKPITSKRVDELLGDGSLVPTRVCLIHLISQDNKRAYHNSRTRSQRSLDHTTSISILYLFRISYTSST